jgi:outer membrane biosynthesis protein TonB
MSGHQGANAMKPGTLGSKVEGTSVLTLCNRAVIFVITLCASIIFSSFHVAPLAAEDVPTPAVTEAVMETPEPVVEPPTPALTVDPALVQPQEPAPTAEPTSVPATEPTAIPTMVPTVAAPAPTTVPTPSPAARTSSVALMNTSTSSDAISGCTGNGPASVAPGAELTATCILARSGQTTVTFDIGVPTNEAGQTAADWQVKVAFGSGATQTSGWVSSATRFTTSSNIGYFTVSLLAPDPGVTAEVVSSTVRVSYSNPGEQHPKVGSATITAILKPAAPDPLDLSEVNITCSPEAASIIRGASQQVTCAVNMPSDLREAAIIIRGVAISAPEGWSVTPSVDHIVEDDGGITLTPDPTTTVQPGGTWSFTMNASPACSAPATGGWTISARIAPIRGGVTGDDVDLPETVFQATATDGSHTASASVVESSLDWDFEASFGDQQATGSLTYKVSGSGCSGWNVSLAANPFTYTGEAQGSALEPGHLQLASTGEPVPELGDGTGVTATGVIGSLDEPRTVLTAASGHGDGTYQQRLNVSITVPGGTPPGTYSSTITVNAATGP